MIYLRNGWLSQGDLTWQDNYAREIAQGKLYGATELPKTDECRVISVISKINFPRSTLEQRVIEKKPKTVPRMVFSDIPGLPPRFIDMPVEESKSESNGAKEGE